MQQTFRLGLGFLCLVLTMDVHALLGKDTDKWISLQTRNFLVIGNASESKIRQQASKLEEFRFVVGSLFFKSEVSSPIPIHVVVFNDDKGFEPFKPRYSGKPKEVGGYFSASPDMNYIAMCTDPHKREAHTVVFHEYTHFLLRDMKSIPLWLNEGLAEFYSTFEISEDGKEVSIGKVIPAHVRFLRQEKLLPLATLLGVDQRSPHYNESEKQGLFYAESWALTHYLIMGKNQARRQQLTRFIELLNAGNDPEKSFQVAFQTDFAAMERELNNYVQFADYPFQVLTLNKKVSLDQNWNVQPLADKEVRYHLGDLLAHGTQPEEAPVYLKAALSIDPQYGPALVSLGFLALRQRDSSAALHYLEAGLALTPGSAYIQFQYAQLIHNENTEPEEIGGPKQLLRLQRMQAALGKAITLDPSFLESYRFLTFLARTGQFDLDHAIVLLKQALAAIPNQGQISLYLATLYSRKGDFPLARNYLAASLKEPGTPQVLEEGKQLEVQLGMEERRRRLLETSRQQIEAGKLDLKSSSAQALGQPGEASSSGLSRANPKIIEGVWTQTICSGKRAVFVIKTKNSAYRLRSEDTMTVFLFDSKNKSRPAQDVTCGTQRSPLPVMAAYRPEPTSQSEGILLSLTFTDSENGKIP